MSAGPKIPRLPTRQISAGGGRAESCMCLRASGDGVRIGVVTKTNPANLLYQRLSAWQETPQNTQPLVFRKGDEDWIPLHLEAVEWAKQVADHIAFLHADYDGPNPAHDLVESILRAIFVVDGGLTTPTSGTHRHISGPELTSLYLLGAQWPTTREFDAEDIIELATIAEDARGLIYDGLPVEARSYMTTLIQHFDEAVAQLERNGSADVRRLANELMGALATYCADEERAPKAKSIIERLGPLLRKAAGFGVSTGAAFALEQGFEAGIKALGMG